MDSPAPLRIAWDYPLSPEEIAYLRQNIAGHQLLLHSKMIEKEIDVAEPAFDLAEADVLYGQPDPATFAGMKNLRWVELSSAGYTRYDNDALREEFRRRSIALTNSSHVYDEPCAEHLAAMILALARDLPGCLLNQLSERQWPHFRERMQRTRVLGGQSVLIYGYGAIARRLVEILQPLRMRLTGVRRQVRGDEEIAMRTEADADRLLGETDHVVNILPDSPSTRGFFGAERFARFKPGARFYNIGRGVTVDQEALEKWLRASEPGSAAYLDVTDPEPLPINHPLWHTPRCYVMPHFAGGHVQEPWRLVEHFLGNLRAFERGEAMVDRLV